MKIFYFYLILLLASLTVFGQTTFQKAYDGNVSAAMSKTNDGGCIMAGTTGGMNGSAVYVVKVDSLGVQQWTGIYNNTDEQGGNISATSDGGYIVIGFYDNGVNGQQTLLLKINSTGAPEWAHCYGVINSGWYQDAGNYVTETSDNGFMATGYSNGGMHLFKTDANGMQQWSRAIAGGTGVCIQRTSDGNCVVLGDINGKIYLSKITLTGTILWEKLYSSPGSCSGSSFQETLDKGLIITGGCAGGSFLLKTDSSGIYQWAKGYSASVGGSSVIQSKDGGYAFVGRDSTHRSFLLLKTFSNGALHWAMAYGDTSSSTVNAYANAVAQGNDMGYFISGQSNLLPGLYLVKTDSQGNSNCNEFAVIPAATNLVFTALGAATIDTLGTDSAISINYTQGGTETVQCFQTYGIRKNDQENSVVIYPNPANDQVTIESVFGSKQNLLLYDANGKIILSNNFAGEITLNCKDLENGVYHLRIKNNWDMVNRKLVVLH